MSKSDSDFEDGVKLKHGSGVGIASDVGYLEALINRIYML